MLLATFFDLLKTTGIDGCNIQLSIINGKPTLVAKFNKTGATIDATDSVQEIRKALATPLLIQFEENESGMDESLIAGLGHVAEDVGDAVEQLKLIVAKPAKKKATKAKTKAVDKQVETTQAAQPVQPALTFDVNAFKL